MHHPFRHEALTYEGSEAFVASAVSILRDGLDRDEGPLMLAASDRLELVRRALGPDAGGVSLVAINEHGRNPSRLITMIHSFLRASSDPRRLVVADSPIANRAPAAKAEHHVCGNLLNSATIQSWPLSVICMFDTTELDAADALEIRRSHPVIRGETGDNDDFDAHRGAELFSAPLPPPPRGARTSEIAGAGLGPMRAEVRSTAAQFGIAQDRADDLVLAVNEIVTNSMRHADGHCRLTMWFDGESAVCEVADDGHLRDPLAGRLAPDPARSSGRGLWLAHHLCDLVQIRSSASGTVVRLYVDC